VLEYGGTEKEINGIIFERQNSVEDNVHFIKSVEVRVDDVSSAVKNPGTASIINNHVLFGVPVEKLLQQIAVSSRRLNRRYNIDDKILGTTIFLEKVLQGGQKPGAGSFTRRETTLDETPCFVPLGLRLLIQNRDNLIPLASVHAISSSIILNANVLLEFKP